MLEYSHRKPHFDRMVVEYGPSTLAKVGRQGQGPGPAQVHTPH